MSEQKTFRSRRIESTPYRERVMRLLEIRLQDVWLALTDSKGAASHQAENVIKLALACKLRPQDCQEVADRLNLIIKEGPSMSPRHYGAIRGLFSVTPFPEGLFDPAPSFPLDDPGYCTCGACKTGGEHDSDCQTTELKRKFAPPRTIDADALLDYICGDNGLDPIVTDTIRHYVETVLIPGSTPQKPKPPQPSFEQQMARAFTKDIDKKAGNVLLADKIQLTPKTLEELNAAAGPHEAGETCGKTSD